MTVQDESTTTTTAAHGAILTDAAAAKAKSLLDQEGRDDLALRIAVQPGGCAGLRYKLAFDDRIARRRPERRLRRRHADRRPDERALPPGRHDRLRRQHREEGLHDRQPERHRILRLRRLVQLSPCARRRSRTGRHCAAGTSRPGCLVVLDAAAGPLPWRSTSPWLRPAGVRPHREQHLRLVRRPRHDLVDRRHLSAAELPAERVAGQIGQRHVRPGGPSTASKNPHEALRGDRSRRRRWPARPDSPGSRSSPRRRSPCTAPSSSLRRPARTIAATTAATSATTSSPTPIASETPSARRLRIVHRGRQRARIRRRHLARVGRRAGGRCRRAETAAGAANSG